MTRFFLSLPPSLHPSLVRHHHNNTQVTINLPLYLLLSYCISVYMSVSLSTCFISCHSLSLSPSTTPLRYIMIIVDFKSLFLYAPYISLLSNSVCLGLYPSVSIKLHLHLS